jgi:murein DD-endopeptidase MepM/ murein hydrolase activator NlpD
MHHQIHLLESALQIQEESFSSLLSRLEDKRQVLASTPAIRPVNGGWVTSRFENRRSPFTGQLEFHQGLDIAASTDTPVMASADGEVIFSGIQGALGKLIVVDHGRGLVTRYGHLHKCVKKEGDRVKREEILGTVGNSGQSTGPHLHYEVRLNGVPVNPEAYILN